MQMVHASKRVCPVPLFPDDLWCYERPPERRCYCGTTFYDVFDEHQCIGCSGLTYKLTRQLCKLGYRNGYEYGAECAIADTIHRRPPRVEVDTATLKVPYLAWADRTTYERAFQRGFKVAHNEIYRAHANMLAELERLLSRRLGLSYFVYRQEKHTLFEPELIRFLGGFLEK